MWTANKYFFHYICFFYIFFSCSISTSGFDVFNLPSLKAQFAVWMFMYTATPIKGSIEPSGVPWVDIKWMLVLFTNRLTNDGYAEFTACGVAVMQAHRTHKKRKHERQAMRGGGTGEACSTYLRCVGFLHCHCHSWILALGMLRGNKVALEGTGTDSPGSEAKGRPNEGEEQVCPDQMSHWIHR